MLKQSVLVVLAAALITIPSFGQASLKSSLPAFEVASVKPAGPLDPARIMSGQMRIGMNVNAARVDIGSMSLSELICIAFRVKPYQVSGPSWLGADRFSIQAKLPEGANMEQVPEMLQALLAERFKLTFHRDDKEQQIYALVVAKNGPKLKESLPDDPAAAGSAAPAGGGFAIGTLNGPVRMSGNPDGKGGMLIQNGPDSAMRMSMGAGGTLRMDSPKMTIGAFAQLLSRFLDLPVEDKTELKGNYQIGLDLALEDMRNAASIVGINMPIGLGMRGAGGAAASDPSGSSIFRSVQELGLKLDSQKAPVGRIVIDSIERVPTEGN